MFELLKARKELKAVYEDWYREVRDMPLLNSDAYTNPCYLGIPDNWFKNKHRILIVGEEMFGEDGNGKNLGYKPNEITKLQNHNLKVFQNALTPPDAFENPFWQRARRVAELGWPVAWTFLDKVGRKWITHSRLVDQDRDLLHSVKIRVLAEEIRILQPTVVFFFGWIGTALKTELPEVYQMLYPGGDKDDSLWKNTYVSFTNGNTMYLFSYNAYSPHWRKKPKNYEEDIISKIYSFTGRGPIEYRIPAIRGEECNITAEEPQAAGRKTQPQVKSSIVRDAVASYALGKTVTSETRESTLTNNPYTERYAEIQKKASESRMSYKQTTTKQRVTLSNGRGAYLYIMPDGHQELVDFSGRRIAVYDPLKDRTTEGNTKVIGKGNLLSKYLS